ncbi:MarR family winged helix-turn-helix transcriptional regulator [Sanguibacter antarcticus]|uniref:DNA-binding MarR family transcriptional regulator n=1 Tax=Sanguibacter antarcticus TaxID=372484 RepID=A0A2A9E9C8_9MICO|nr:MarR family winged helix-turn-helix transcriptional regulator [Sanguibacter antarcticus]PFG35131.1 DNA-binding MarR family transcriptional regulator [Sanguibacter antarcticus]
MDDPFVALERELSRFFRRAHGAATEISALAHPGLDSELYTLLAYIDRHPGSLAKNVAAEFRLDPGTVSRQLSRSESAALIQRTPDPNDNRGMTIELTEAGREALVAARDARTALVRNVLSEWHSEDVLTFSALLHRLLTFDRSWNTEDAASLISRRTPQPQSDVSARD